MHAQSPPCDRSREIGCPNLFQTSTRRRWTPSYTCPPVKVTPSLPVAALCLGDLGGSRARCPPPRSEGAKQPSLFLCVDDYDRNRRRAPEEYTHPTVYSPDRARRKRFPRGTSVYKYFFPVAAGRSLVCGGVFEDFLFFLLIYFSGPSISVKFFDCNRGASVGISAR